MDGSITDPDVRALEAQEKFRAIVRGLLDDNPVVYKGDRLRAWIEEVTERAMGMLSPDDLAALSHLLPEDETPPT